MQLKDLNKKFEAIINEPSTISWTKFLMESIVSVVLGLAIAFMTTSIISTAIILSTLIIPLVIYTIVLITYKNKISLLAMLDNELKNRHYENVIILGLQISNTLFNTKQNENRVRIGRKVEEALRTCDRELGEIIIDGKELTKEFIDVKLNIDDLGWSLYQANKKNWVEAVDTIKKGIFSAEKMAIELQDIKDGKSQDYIQMSIKGYRHLVGIFLDKEINKINEGILIEKVIKVIISNGEIINNSNLTNYNHISANQVISIVSLESYLKSSNEGNSFYKEFIDEDYLERLSKCMRIYRNMEEKEKSKIINDLYYAFSRNNIKILRIIQDKSQKANLLKNSIQFADLYKGSEHNRKSKRWIRYKSLLNEINIANASQNNIANTINEIRDTILQCTTRTDLYFRNSTLLVHALTLHYELSIKSNSSLNKHQKIYKIQQLQSSITKIKKDVKKIDIVSDEEFNGNYIAAKIYLQNELNSIK